MSNIVTGLARFAYATHTGHAAALKNIESVKSLYREHPEFCAKYHYAINPNLYIAISGADLLELIHSSVFCISSWKRRLQCRHLAIHIVEFFDDLPALFGKEFRQRLSEDSRLFSHQTSFDKTFSEFHSERKLVEKDLRRLRNFAAAHRHKSAMEMLNAIEDVKWLDIFNCSGRVLALHSLFSGCLTSLQYSLLETINER